MCYCIPDTLNNICNVNYTLKVLKCCALLSKAVQSITLKYFPLAVTVFNLDISINRTSKNRNV